MNTKTLLFLLSVLTCGCGVKIPPGHYTNTNGPSFGGTDIILKENGRFHYRSWSDDSAPSIGQGGYVTRAGYLFLMFENMHEPKNGYSIKEIEFTNVDSQDAYFTILNPAREPIPAVSFYYDQDSSFGTISQIDGKGQLSMPKTKENKTLVPHYVGIAPLEIIIPSDKCVKLEVILSFNIDRLQLGEHLLYNIKKEEDQYKFKLHYRKNYQN
ncbi:MAG: hypothetical protein AAF969_18240 [Bacteroidota bacterium]